MIVATGTGAVQPPKKYTVSFTASRVALQQFPVIYHDRSIFHNGLKKCNDHAFICKETRPTPFFAQDDVNIA